MVNNFFFGAQEHRDTIFWVKTHKGIVRGSVDRANSAFTPERMGAMWIRHPDSYLPTGNFLEVFTILLLVAHLIF